MPKMLTTEQCFLYIIILIELTEGEKHYAIFRKTKTVNFKNILNDCEHANVDDYSSACRLVNGFEKSDCAMTECASYSIGRTCEQRNTKQYNWFMDVMGMEDYVTEIESDSNCGCITYYDTKSRGKEFSRTPIRLSCGTGRFVHVYSISQFFTFDSEYSGCKVLTQLEHCRNEQCELIDKNCCYRKFFYNNKSCKLKRKKSLLKSHQNKCEQEQRESGHGECTIYLRAVSVVTCQDIQNKSNVYNCAEDANKIRFYDHQVKCYADFAKVKYECLVLPGTTLSTVLKMSTAVYSHWTSDVISVDGLTYTENISTLESWTNLTSITLSTPFVSAVTLFMFSGIILSIFAILHVMKVTKTQHQARTQQQSQQAEQELNAAEYETVPNFSDIFRSSDEEQLEKAFAEKSWEVPVLSGNLYAELYGSENPIEHFSFPEQQDVNLY